MKTENTTKKDYVIKTWEEPINVPPFPVIFEQGVSNIEVLWIDGKLIIKKNKIMKTEKLLDALCK